MAERENVGEAARVGAPEINVVADPAPLGLGAFAFTTFMLSLSNANVLKAGAAIAFPAALWYGGIAQILAGMWEFRNKGNTFGATAFTSYGAFWLTFYWLETSSAKLLTGGPADARVAVGAYLLGWTIFTFYMWVGTFRLNGGNVCAPHDRQVRRLVGDLQARRVGRHRHRARGLVRGGSGRHQQHVQEDGGASLARRPLTTQNLKRSTRWPFGATLFVQPGPGNDRPSGRGASARRRLSPLAMLVVGPRSGGPASAACR